MYVGMNIFDFEMHFYDKSISKTNVKGITIVVCFY